MEQKAREFCNGYETFSDGCVMMKGGIVTVIPKGEILGERKVKFVFENAYYRFTKNAEDNKMYLKVFASDLETKDTESLLLKYPASRVDILEYRR